MAKTDGFSQPEPAPAMQQARASQMHFYSVGIVAANKPIDSKDIEVVPVEQTPNLSGELSDNLEIKNTTVTSGGNTSEVNVKSTASIKATWLPLGQTSRKTPPDVRRGERVQLLRFGDADKYYWIDFEQSKKLRRLETVVFALSNNSKENVEDTADSTYYLEWSTHRKIFHLHTSKNDGEPFAYDIQLNAKDGKLIITDDASNTLSLDSRERSWRMQNTDGSFLDMTKAVITGKTAESINFETNAFNVKASSISMQSSSYDVQSTSVNYGSSTYSIGTGSYGMSASGSSTSTSGGVMNMNSAGFMHNGVNISSTHTHTGVHGETSPPH